MAPCSSGSLSAGKEEIFSVCRGFFEGSKKYASDIGGFTGQGLYL